MRNLEDYLDLNYRFFLRKDGDGDYVAEVDELPGCIADGATPDEAISHLRDAMKSWMASRIDAGLDIPEPRSTSEYSGRFVVRMPKTLHRKLSEMADSEGVSLNQYVVSLLSESCGASRSFERQVQIGPLNAGYIQLLPGSGLQATQLINAVKLAEWHDETECFPNVVEQEVLNSCDQAVDAAGGQPKSRRIKQSTQSVLVA
jgi:antitoxin HicB